MSNYIITGGAGFIGTNLIKELLKDESNKIISMDSYITGRPENHIDNPRAIYIKTDISKSNEVTEWNALRFFGYKNDYVVNLACPASPVAYQKSSYSTLRTNIYGVSNMIDVAERGNAIFLQASTSEVYGDPLEHPQKETYCGNVQMRGPRSCYVDDVEILTENGWKLFSDLNNNEKVATLNQENNQLEYFIPDEIIEQDYSGDVYTFQNSNVDISVTPNHKMYVKSRNVDKFTMIEAQNMRDIEHSHMLKTADSWNGKYQEYFFFPEETKNIKFTKHPIIDKFKMNDWLEFMGYFLTEGCVYIRDRTKIVNGKTYQSKDYRIQISQSKEKNPEIFNKIENCLNRLEIKYTVSECGNSYFVFQNKQIAMYLKQFGKSKEKYIPREFFDLSSEQLTILYNAMLDGDGTKESNDRSRVFYSISKSLVDGIQELLLKLGHKGNIQYNESRGIYYVSCIENVKESQYPIPKIEQYSGKVYCVNVTNHVIFVRRNGKAIFCVNCYDEGKRVAETIIYENQIANRVNARIIRIFNTYGPHMAKDDGRVVSNFIMQALTNKDITIYGNGDQTRSFCYVTDLVDGLLKVLHGNYSDPVNLGNPKEFTMIELANLIIKLVSEMYPGLGKSDIVFLPLPKDDPRQRRPDISLANSLYGWQPKVELEEGLIQTIKYFHDYTIKN